MSWTTRAAQAVMGRGARELAAYEAAVRGTGRHSSPAACLAWERVERTRRAGAYLLARYDRPGR